MNKFIELCKKIEALQEPNREEVLELLDKCMIDMLHSDLEGGVSGNQYELEIEIEMIDAIRNNADINEACGTYLESLLK